MTEAALKDRARRAARAWGGARGEPRLVLARENAVFEAELADAGRAALRLHRPGLHSRQAVEAELRWIAALDRAGLACPRPIASREGRFAALDGTGCASAVGWIPGKTLSFAGATVGRERQAYRVGALIGAFHEAADAVPPLRHRPAWDLDALTGPDPRWGRFWENPALNAEEASMLRHVRDGARTALQTMTQTERGPIHGDVLPDNVIDDGARLWLIDFDDAGPGYRTLDLATALIGEAQAPDLPRLARALVAGYSRRRTPGTAARLLQELPLFLALRAMASAGWAMTRLPPGDARGAAYAARAVACALAWRDASA